MTGSITKRSVALTSCAGLALSWVCAGSAEAAEAAGFTVGGKSVTLSADSGHGTPLEPGMYGIKLPAQTGTWYATIKRKQGERLQIGALGQVTWDNGPYVLPAGSSQDLSFSLETADGTMCQTNDIPVPSGTRRGVTFQSYLASDPASDQRVQNLGQDSQACRQATTFQLSVKRSITGSQSGQLPVQLSVVTVPAISSSVTAPGTDTTGALQVTPASPSGKITPGRGILDAPGLAPKAYSVDAVPGQPLFVKVHLAPGQRLAVDWQLPSNDSSSGVAQDLYLTTNIYGPSLGEVSMGSGTDGAKISPSTTGSMDISSYTAPVNYDNADMTLTKQEKSLTPTWFQTDPGWYYVMLNAVPDVKNKNDKTLKSTAPIPSTLTLQVTGQATSGPKMAVSQPQGNRLSGAPTSGRVNPIVWGGLAVLGGLGVLATAVAMRRRARG